MKGIETARAPQAIGPYVQAVCADGYLFLSGQLGIDPETGQLVTGDVGQETEQALRNLEAVLLAGGSSLERVVKTTVYMCHLEEFQRMNEVYAQFFSNWKPARATVEVSRLPLGARVEIEAMAMTGGSDL